jgi:hypothetical protein
MQEARRKQAAVHLYCIKNNLEQRCIGVHVPNDRSVWDDYEADTELIGRGAFARVFKAIRREDQQPVAIKVIGRDTKAFKQQRRGEAVPAIFQMLNAASLSKQVCCNFAGPSGMLVGHIQMTGVH